MNFIKKFCNKKELNDDDEIFDEIYNEIYKISSDLYVIRELINNYDNFNINMINGCSLLHWAVIDEKYEIITYFIHELNANVNIYNNDHLTPIMFAKSSQMIQFLINNGANMYHVDIHGGNVLMSAVVCNRIDIMETLINKYDYCVDMKDNENRSIFNSYYCRLEERYDNLVSICKKNDLNRIYVLQEFIDIGCDNNNNNDDIPSSIQGISYNEARERALEYLNDNNNEELLRRQIAIERIPSLFNTQKGSMFDYRLVGMIFEYINTKPLIPKWNGSE